MPVNRRMEVQVPLSSGETGPTSKSTTLASAPSFPGRTAEAMATHRDSNPFARLTLEELKKIVAEFPRLDRVVLHGIGEPLLNKEIFSMVEYLKTRGATVLFNSDAISLTPPRARRLIASGLDELRVSMDAATPETYRKIRGVPQFDWVVRNLTEFVSVQRELRANTPKLSLWFVGTRTNVAEHSV